MGGLSALSARMRFVEDLYYGTDYHSHLGTKRGAWPSQRGQPRPLHP